MTDKNFLRSLKKDLDLIHSNIGKLDESDLELLLSSAIYRIEEQLYFGKVKAKDKHKPKSSVNNEMIEERVYPEDYLERAKYILARIKYHYHNYKITYQYIKTAKKERYFGIPPFEFWAIKNDLDFFALEFKGNLKEYKDIFFEHKKQDINVLVNLLKAAQAVILHQKKMVSVILKYTTLYLVSFQMPLSCFTKS